MAETQSQRLERIRQQLNATRACLERDLESNSDVTLKRIEVDAATVVTLSQVSELLPEPIQKQVTELLSLHEQVWNMDAPVALGHTPRKPLGERIFHRFAFFAAHPAKQGWLR